MLYFVAPVPVDLADGSLMVADSGAVMEKIDVLSNGSARDSQPQEEDDAEAVTLALFHDDSITNVSSGAMSANSPSTNQVMQTEISDSCDSVLCQVKHANDCNELDTSHTAAVETHNGQTAQDAVDCTDAHFSLLQDRNSNVEDDSLYKDLQPVDPCELRSTLWPKSAFLTSDAADNSFSSLAADHKNYCKENVEVSAGQKVIFSSCGETGTLQDSHEAVWPVVSRWLKESNQQFCKQFPECSVLIRGLPASDKKLHVNIDASAEKLDTSVARMETLNSTLVLSKVTDEPVASLSSQNSIISNYSSLNTGYECSNHLLSPASLSREKILSLQFSGVSLSPEVIARIKELKLKRMDGTLLPLDGKQMTRNSKQLESRSSTVRKLGKSASASNEIPAAATTKGAYQEQPASKLDAVPAVGTDSKAECHDLQDTHVPHHTPSSTESANSTDILVSGITQAVLSGPSILQSMISQSYTFPTVSHSSRVSDLSAETSLVNLMSRKEKSAHKLHSTVETARECPLKTCSSTAPLSNSPVLPSIHVGVSIATTNVSAVTPQSFIPSFAASDSLSQTASPTVSDRPPTKKYNTQMASKTLPDHNYHKNFVSSSAQQHVPRSKHRVTNKNPRRETDKIFTEERCHKLREGSSYTEGSVSSPAARLRDPESRSKSQREKCSRCRNVKSNAAYDPSYVHNYQARASRHQNPYYLHDHYNAYRPYHMPDMSASVLASVSYSSYCLGAYDAHVRSMQYYNMLSHQATANVWQLQADYIRRMAKFHTRRPS